MAWAAHGEEKDKPGGGYLGTRTLHCKEGQDGLEQGAGSINLHNLGIDWFNLARQPEGGQLGTRPEMQQCLAYRLQKRGGFARSRLIPWPGGVNKELTAK